MKANRLYLTVFIVVLLAVFSLIFTVVGVLTPSEKFDELSGFGKIFAASPEFSFESGSLITSFGKYSLSINFSFDKPMLAILSDAPVIHLNFLPLVVVLVLMAVSCAIPEVSIATSGVVAALVGITLFKLIPDFKQEIANGASAWDVAAGSFWFIVFLFTVLIVNGLVGIGGKVVDIIFLDEIAKTVVTLLVAVILANAISLFLCLFAYLTVGLGWCGGVMLWFIVAIAFVVFCEVMDVISI